MILPEILNSNKNNSVRGFTIMEFIVTIGLMAILSAVILYFLNPAQQYAQARNNQRISNVNTIAEAIYQRIIDTHYNFANGCASGVLPATTTQLGSGAGNYNIEPCLVPTYIPTMPLDPSNGTSSATGYYIAYVSTTMIFTVSAPNAELGQSISVTK